MSATDSEDSTQTAENGATEGNGAANGNGATNEETVMADASKQGEPADEPREPEEDEEEEKAPPTLEEQLAAAKDNHDRAREKMMRVAADFDNFRKRTARELDDVRRRAKQSAVKDLLSVFDNVHRATAHVGDDTDAKSIADGLRMVHKQFIDTLGKMGIERIEAEGRTFDPTVHDSIQHIHSDEHDAGVIINELQAGYKMGTELLRAAMVVVSRGPAPQEAQPPAENKTVGGADDTAPQAAITEDSSPKKDEGE